MKLNELISASSVDTKLDYHKNLNAALWHNFKLFPEVRKKLLLIAEQYIKFLKINKELVDDIVIVGSNVGYNWTKYSDIDLHVIVDEERVSLNPVLREEYFAAKKKIWNDDHDIKIHGFDVELYAQDISEGYENKNGVYSILHNHWLQRPTYEQPTYNDHLVKLKSARYMNKIDKMFEDKDVISLKSVKRLKDKIKDMRKESLHTGGQFSIGNLVFKTLRNNDYLDKLSEVYRYVFDKKFSLK